MSASIDSDIVVRCILGGGVAVLPTDTLYSLSVDATSFTAVEKVFRIKNRIRIKPLPVFVSSLEQAKEFFYFNELALFLAGCFWPGPLTIILETRGGIAQNISTSKKIAVRVPAHYLLNDIIAKLGRPITGTSANISCKNDILNYKEVVAEFGGKVDIIVNGNLSGDRVASTIVEVSSNKLEIVRCGALDLKDFLK